MTDRELLAEAAFAEHPLWGQAAIREATPMGSAGRLHESPENPEPIKSKSPMFGASVTDRGLEPRTNCLRGNCSAIELVGLAAVLYPKGIWSQ